MEFCAPLCHLTWGGNGLPRVEFTDKIKVKCKIPQIFESISRWGLILQSLASGGPTQVMSS